MAYSDGSSEDFTKMQEEALKRLREMQRRSKIMVDNPHHAGQGGFETEDQNTQASALAMNQSGARPKPGSESSPRQIQDIIKSILGEGVKLDSDRLLILLMLFVLYKNKADIKLLAALGYLVL